MIKVRNQYMKYILTMLLVCFLGTLPLQAQISDADKRELKKAVKLVEKEIKNNSNGIFM